MFCATPSCSPASDIISLKVDPGASCAWMVLFSSGWLGSVISLFQSSRPMRTAKCIWVERRPAQHGQNLPGMRIHRDHRAIPVAKGILRRPLNIEINGELQALTRLRRLGAQLSHLAAMAVDQHIARPVLAAQKRVVRLLHTRRAHHIARLVVRIARIVQHVLAHLAHIPDQVRGKPVLGIQPALLVDCFQLRHLIAMRLDELLLIRSDVLLERQWLILRSRPVVLQNRRGSGRPSYAGRGRSAAGRPHSHDPARAPESMRPKDSCPPASGRRDRRAVRAGARIGTLRMRFASASAR